MHAQWERDANTLPSFPSVSRLNRSYVLILQRFTLHAMRTSNIVSVATVSPMLPLHRAQHPAPWRRQRAKPLILGIRFGR